MLENARCIVLNSTYELLNVVSARRGLIIVMKGKAAVLEEHPTSTASTSSKNYPVPSQIVLKEYVKGRPAFKVPAQLSQRNLFVRDSYTCRYCGRTRGMLSPPETLTRDHIHPRDLGGKDVWANVVAACNSCNNRKANFPFPAFLKALRNERDEIAERLSRTTSAIEIEKMEKLLEYLKNCIVGAEKIQSAPAQKTPTVFEIQSRKTMLGEL